MKSGNKFASNEIYALVFGLFLGVCILKFGDPVILDQKIYPPVSLYEWWNDSWPTHWANWFWVPLAAIGAIFIFPLLSERQLPCPRRLLILPLLWLGWQFISASQTVDANLTTATLWQFSGCAACYFIGLFLFRLPRILPLLLAGILAAFTVCLIHATHQHFEFPQSQKFLIEGQRTGWTNFPPALMVEMKRDQTIITTNGMDVINPAITARFAKNRVMGTLVYPNALAGLILMLFPVSIVLAFHGTKKLRPLVRGPAIVVTLALSLAAFFWSGSKFGWLIAIAMGGLCLLRLNWPLKLKITAIAMVAILGLGIFAVRFHSYFANGATSATARLDYWHAAVQTTRSAPLFGTGPGTFQRLYARLKAPDAEMARLTHNDYLEQFSDSGICGGLFYAAWIVASLIFLGKHFWKTDNPLIFAVFLGVLAWFIQAFGEFQLYIPALAWLAFALMGCLLGQKSNPFDKKSPLAKIPAQ